MHNETKSKIAGTLSVLVAVIFVQSLFFKFTNSPETQHIFGTIRQWAEGFGFGWFFAPTGPGGQYAIGTGELIAAITLVVGTFVSKCRKWQGAGALLALALISGAIFFHLATPLGVQVLDDGGLLFGMASVVWLSSLAILLLRRGLTPVS